ncbi:MAG: GDP-L-fucose synthase [Deltaproteobacteria bacterium]|nr:GDP-L-fucose synthase [Deltaproteobacteria bacterium]
MNENSKIYLAGHSGMVGGAILRHLKKKGFKNITLKSHSELDLTNQVAVFNFFQKEKPEYVFLAAARVGGILANSTHPADFIFQNLMIQTNVIHSSFVVGVRKLLFLGSSCIYPRDCPQPIKEEYLLSGPLEKTNAAYATAKISGIEMCTAYNRQYGTNFISIMPTNLYGPGDNYDLESSHVVPALIRKFHEGLPGKPVTLWGTGRAKREFLHVDDLADACLYLFNSYNESEIINVGTGEDISVFELAILIQKIVGHKGEILWDNTKPDGTPQKLLDVSKIHGLGWSHKFNLEEGLRSTYLDYIGTLKKG